MTSISQTLFSLVLAVSAGAAWAQDGANGTPITITADGSTQNYDSPGANGAAGWNGSDGASYGNNGGCSGGNETEPSGGDGGNGGNGGSGGDGGAITVYYTDLANLGSIAVIDTPGQGGPGGYGGSGGSGGSCGGTYSCPYGCDATGANCSYYSCTDGGNGYNGANGSPGANGAYGSIFLINGSASAPIKPDVPSVYVDMANMADGTVSLSTNLWDTRSGAHQLFKAGSDLADSYFLYRGRTEAQYAFKWAAATPITSYAGKQMHLHFVNGQIEVDFPGDLLVKTETATSGGITTLTIDTIYSVDQASELTMGDLVGYGTAMTLSLADAAKLSQVVQTAINLVYYTADDDGNYAVRFQGPVPPSALTTTVDGLRIAVGQLAIPPTYLASGTNAYIKLGINRTLGSSETSLGLENTYAISAFFPGAAVQAANDADLYSDSSVVGHVTKGDKFKIVQINGQWASLVTLTGAAVTGWIQLSDLTPSP